jgi:membrane protease subunit HflK
MEVVLQGTNKIVIDNEGGSQGVLPYLPLPELQKQNNRQTGSN